jgi:hypothetical protein
MLNLQKKKRKEKRQRQKKKKGHVNLVRQAPSPQALFFFLSLSLSLFFALLLSHCLSLLINAKKKGRQTLDLRLMYRVGLFTGDASLPPLATMSPLMRPSSDAGLKI